VPGEWYEPWRSLRLEASLDEAERKEFRVEA
jgi:hypothetical protein